MNAFEYRSDSLYAEDVPVETMAEEYGTPLYVYSRAMLRGQYRALRDAMSDIRPLICYSVKANPSGAVIGTLVAEGAGIDVVSGGELFRALKAGADPRKTVFAGVGKTTDEIEYALREEIFFFTVESEQETRRISDAASRMGVEARIVFRVNPDVDPHTHKHVATGKKGTKFGIEMDQAAAFYAMAAKLPAVRPVGLHMHLGSQIVSPDPFVQALDRVGGLCRQLKTALPDFRYLDMGGGLGVAYQPEQAGLSPVEFAARTVKPLRELGMDIILEPGRFLTAETGILVCRVQYVKKTADKTFVIVDAGMNDLIRPALYDAYHRIVSVRRTAETVRADVVGPVCETGDFIALDRDVPAVVQGDLISVMTAGAYCASMGSSYNSRPRPAEILVDGSDAILIRKRETWDDLILREQGV